MGGKGEVSFAHTLCFFQWHGSFIPLACAEFDDSMSHSGAFSIPYTLSFHPFPPTSHPSSLASSCHLFLGLPLSLVVYKFIYKTCHLFLGLPLSLVVYKFIYKTCHLFLGLLLNLVVPKFIYNTFMGILFSSILCTRPIQHIQFYFLPFSVHAQTNIIYLTLLSLL